MATTFEDWLRAQAGDDDAALLLDFKLKYQDTSGLPPADWPPSKYGSKFSLSGSLFSDELRNKYFDALSRLENRWHAHKKDSLFFRFLSQITAGGFMLVVFGLCVAVFIGMVLFGRDFSFLAQMASIDTARGLITFLFALATTAIFLLIAVALFWMENVDVRFDRAKDLLAMLVGIFGTILGFYFASSGSGDDAARFAFGSMVLTPPVIAAGSTTTLAVSLDGGEAPFSYSVRVTPIAPLPAEAVDALKTLNVSSPQTTNSDFDQALAIPEAAGASSLWVTVSAQDAAGQKLERSLSLVVLPKGVAASPP